MQPVLIGSRALAYWNPEMKLKPDTDWDVISYAHHEGCEVHDPDFLNNKQMLDYSSNRIVKLPDGTNATVMFPLGLAIIKRSHLWRNLSFDKHITMYHKFGLADLIKEFGKTDIVQKDLQARIDMTKKAFPQRNPNLMQTKEDFFDDAVTKKYDHDYLHELFAYYDKPLYTRMLRDKNLAWCNKDQWETFTHEDQLKCVAEETYVIAAERFLIPNNWNFPSKLAYMKALTKVCTTLTSGWFRDKAIDFYPEIVNLYDKKKFHVVQSKLSVIERI